MQIYKLSIAKLTQHFNYNLFAMFGPEYEKESWF